MNKILNEIRELFKKNLFMIFKIFLFHKIIYCINEINQSIKILVFKLLQFIINLDKIKKLKFKI